MAAHNIGEATLWNAGARLMHAENPNGFDEVIIAVDMRRANHEACAACADMTARINQTVRCTIRLE